MQTNRFEVSGYLAAKPVLRKLPSGTPVANVRLGQTYLFDTKEGRGKQTNWFNLAFYGALATIATTYEKGDNITLLAAFSSVSSPRKTVPHEPSMKSVFKSVIASLHNAMLYHPGL